jgi:ADP-heptose:LPS heptosyltransferase
MNISALKSIEPARNKAASAKTEKPEGVLKRFFNRKKEYRILSVIGESAELSQINSVLQTVSLLKIRYPEYKLHILTSSRFEKLFLSVSDIDAVHIIDPAKSLASLVRGVRPAVLYIPFQGFAVDFRLLGTGKILLGTDRSEWWSKLTGIIPVDSQKGLDTAHKKGINLYPQAPASNHFSAHSSSDRILFNVFSSNENIHNFWSVSHASRFLRLCHKDNLEVSVPVFTHTPLSDVKYLQSRAPDVRFEEDCNAEKLLGLMKSSRLVIGARSEELKLAHLLGRPSLMLDSYSKVHKINMATMVLKPGKHLDDCDDNCDNCEKGNCIDLISPERVHEAVLKILSPV